MYVDFRMLNSCGSLYKRHDLFLNIVRNLYDVAAVEDVDNHINDDLFIYKLYKTVRQHLLPLRPRI